MAASRYVGSRWMFPAALLGMMVLRGCQCESGDENVEHSEAHAALDGVTDLGACSVGRTCHLDLFLHNDGNDILRIHSVTLKGSAFSHGGLPPTLDPDGHATLTVSFQPVVEGPASARLVILSNASDHPEIVETITALGTPASLYAEPTELDFGDLDPGGSRTLEVTIHNRAVEPVNATLRIVDDSWSSFVLQISGHPATTIQDITVAAQGQQRVSITFSPTMGGALAGELNVEFCGSGCGIAVALRGSLRAPRIDVTPVRLDFGRMQQGAAAEKELTLLNRGNGALTVQSADVVMGMDNFSLTSTLPITLAPDETASLTVRFVAPQAGHVDGRIRLASNDARTPQVLVDLTGAASGMDVVVVPSAVDFGTLYDQAPAFQDVVVLNRGDADAQLLAALVDGDAFALAVVPPVPVELGVGGALVLSVAFNSTVLGPSTGTLRITTDNPVHPDTNVPLTAGRAQRDCSVVPSTAELGFGMVRIGQVTQQMITLRNAGSAACTISAPRWSPLYPNDACFTVSGADATLLPGESRQVAVRFAPTSLGHSRAVMQVDVLGQPPVLCTARGKGVNGEVSANPAFVDFGSVPINCGTATRRVTILSLGSDVVLLDQPTLQPSPPFHLATASVPSQLMPGLALTLTLSFSPTHLGPANGELRMVTHIPDEVELVVGLAGQGSDSHTPVTDTFQVQGTQLMDVLFVIDNSGSMYDNQQRLSENARRFIDMADFRGQYVDFHLGITTTDTTEEGARGKLVGTPAVMTRNLDVTSQFTQRAMVGVNGSGWEQGLEAARLALSPPAIMETNRGFLRTEAGLAVVVVTDEEDQSPLEVEQYVDFFRGLKAGTQAPVVISGITGGPGGCQDTETGDMGYPTSRYPEAVQATGGISELICTRDWGQSLEKLGETVFLARGRFQLTSTPIPGSISVKVGGRAVTTGWTYVPMSNQVVFDRDHLPNPGAVVEVSYQVACNP